MPRYNLMLKAIPVAMAFHAFGCMADPSADTADVGEDAALGEAEGELCGSTLVQNVVFLPDTVYFNDPAHLLVASEGAGPRDLSLTATTSATTTISVSGAYTPDNAAISKAVGFDVTDSVSLIGSSSIQVPTNGYARLAAYPLYQQITWSIAGMQCGTGIILPLGTGCVYKPIGVYFETSSVECVPGASVCSLESEKSDEGKKEVKGQKGDKGEKGDDNNDGNDQSEKGNESGSAQQGGETGTGGTAGAKQSGEQGGEAGSGVTSGAKQSGTTSGVKQSGTTSAVKQSGTTSGVKQSGVTSGAKQSGKP